MVYMGEPAGFAVTLEDGLTISVCGDTAIFSDMRLIAEIYKLAIAFVPIGDCFAMGPDTAALATDMLGVTVGPTPALGRRRAFLLLTGPPRASGCCCRPVSKYWESTQARRLSRPSVPGLRASSRYLMMIWHWKRCSRAGCRSPEPTLANRQHFGITGVAIGWCVAVHVLPLS
jgi:hypothetical protein